MEEVIWQLEEESVRRKAVVDDLNWLLQKGIIRVVDKVVESLDFSLGVRHMKAAYMAIEVKVGKKVIREQIATGEFVFGEPSTLLEHTQVMHADVKCFLETEFSSYLLLVYDFYPLLSCLKHCLDLPGVCDTMLLDGICIRVGPCLAFLSRGAVRHTI